MSVRSEWTFRWWDAAALLAVAAAAALIIAYGTTRSPGKTAEVPACTLDVLIPAPPPELAGQVVPEARLYDRRGDPIGRVLAVSPQPPSAPAAPGVPAGPADLRVACEVAGELTLSRSLPGFPPGPGELAAGDWCLLRLPRAVLSGLILRVELRSATAR